MRLKLLFPLLISGLFLSGQSFTEVPHFNAFAGVGDGDITFADMNGDQHPDLLITGPIARLYLNNGLGQFVETMPPPFASLEDGSLAIADVNGDQHPDVLITGYDGSTQITRLYLNDGE